MKVPLKLLNSLEGVQGFERKAFEEVHASGEQVTSIRINPKKVSGVQVINSLPLGEPVCRSGRGYGEAVPWSEYGYYLSKRPSFTFDPLFHAGCYYVQEASSMFLEVALKQTVDLTKALKVLDVCAAPGGKSTHLHSLISDDSLLVSNEVIRSRSNILKQNVIKWGAKNVVITNNDPIAFQKLPGFFDVIVVDAPCSGSGLFRKDADAINEWSPNNVALCCQRQKRILADVLPSLKENGIFIYSTCSYSKEEDEDIADWLVEKMQMQNFKLKIEDSWGIVETISGASSCYGYRFFPDKLKGEGFYLSVFTKNTGTESMRVKEQQLQFPSQAEKNLINMWTKNSELLFVNMFDSIYAIPQKFLNDISVLRSLLNVQYAGVEAGVLMKNKFVPAHALAVNKILSGTVRNNELSYDDAVKYLQKQEISIENESTGWQTVSFNNHKLGWINKLKNRINNYYPKELRILKQHNNLSFKK